jgi:hypothetical protein
MPDPPAIPDHYGQVREEGWTVVFDERSPEDRWIAIEDGYPVGP